MKRNNSIYTSLCTIFSILIIVGNLTYQKFIILPIFFYTFEVSVGTMLYPLTFLLVGIITEFYGKEKAHFCVRLAISMNIFVACIITVMDQLESTIWSKIDDATFHKVFGLYGVAFIGSVLACYIAQIVDINIYMWIRKITKDKQLWARSNGSMIISLFIDTFIVITFVTLFHVISVERMWPLIINSYLFKLFFSICSTPLFYILVRFITNFRQNKKIYFSKINRFS